jgi:hypothetical protein
LDINDYYKRLIKDNTKKEEIFRANQPHAKTRKINEVKNWHSATWMKEAAGVDDDDLDMTASVFFALLTTHNWAK